MVRAFAALLLTIALAPAAMAQGDTRKCADAEFDARSVPLDDEGPFAGASHKPGFAYAANGPNCRIITFYRLPAKAPGVSPRQMRVGSEYKNKTAPPFFAARYIDDSRGANYKPRWTDQDRCPALVPQIAKLEPILAPKLTGEGPYRHGSTSITDQPVIRFWLAGQVYPQHDVDHTLDLTMEGGSGAPFGAWLFETFKVLDACWSSEPPTLP
jgi:hypothetical protein